MQEIAVLINIKTSFFRLPIFFFYFFQIRTKDFEQFDFPGAQELAAMFEFYQKAQIVRDIRLTKRLNPEYKTFEKWLDDEAETVENALKDQDF